VALEEAARLTLGVGLMAVALRIPPDALRRLGGSLAVLLTVGMLGMWAATSALAYAVLGLPPLVALLLGAVCTPTDPTESASVVTGRVAQRLLPERLRDLLSAESGFNDGLALPFVMLGLLLMEFPAGAALHEWAFGVWLHDVALAAALGAAVGAAAGAVLHWADRRGVMGHTSLLAFTFALALTVLASVKLLGSDGILAVFVAGLVFGRGVDARERTEEEHVVEAFDRFFSLPIFALLGAALPFAGWAALGWRGALFAALVLVLRRPPVVLALAPWLGALPARPDRRFVAWFGPVGVAAVFYAALALRQTGLEVVWHAATLAVVASLLAHGFSATPLTKRYARATGRTDALASLDQPEPGEAARAESPDDETGKPDGSAGAATSRAAATRR
jgi:NhaP-type Na+/H+ or K+/H+ antiporter